MKIECPWCQSEDFSPVMTKAEVEGVAEILCCDSYKKLFSNHYVLIKVSKLTLEEVTD
jgi:hypothetical protein